VPRNGAPRLRLHRLQGKAALTGVAGQAGLGTNAATDWGLAPGAVQHPRHLHHACPVSRRGPGLGSPGLRHLGTDDLQALSQMDAWSRQGPRTPSRRCPGRRFRGRRWAPWSPKWSPRAPGNGKTLGKSTEKKWRRGESNFPHRVLTVYRSTADGHSRGVEYPVVYRRVLFSGPPGTSPVRVSDRDLTQFSGTARQRAGRTRGHHLSVPE
jgi:hypothetical protein